MIKNIKCTAPCLTKGLAKGLWEYHEPWQCEIQTDSGVYSIIIMPGYWTDLASVPKAVRNIFDIGASEYGVLIASQVHDALYSTHYMSKDFADKIFYEILRYYGMNFVKANIYYKAVSWFGNNAWDDADIHVGQMEADKQLIMFKWNDKK